MSNPRYLLWIDTESTGLLDDATVPTALEVSWTITDTDGCLLLPIRQRFLCLPLVQERDRIEDWTAHAPLWWPCTQDGQALDNTSVVRWASEDRNPDELDSNPTPYPSPFVRDMHENNGLAHAFSEFAHRQAAALTNPAATADELPLIIEWTQLGNLLRRDLEMVDPHAERHDVVLAGGGVGHYERPYLRAVLPSLFVQDERLHYAVADVSTVLRTFTTRLLRHATPETHLHRADNVLDWARRNPALVPIDWRALTLAEDTGDARTPWSDPDRPADPAAAYLDGDADTHRAVAGVVRALAAYRVLPYAAEHMLTRWADADDISAIGGREATR